jgi:hypothetical protein
MSRILILVQPSCFLGVQDAWVHALDLGGDQEFEDGHLSHSGLLERSVVDCVDDLARVSNANTLGMAHYLPCRHHSCLHSIPCSPTKTFASMLLDLLRKQSRVVFGWNGRKASPKHDEKLA